MSRTLNHGRPRKRGRRKWGRARYLRCLRSEKAIDHKNNRLPERPGSVFEMHRSFGAKNAPQDDKIKKLVVVKIQSVVQAFLASVSGSHNHCRRSSIAVRSSATNSAPVTISDLSP